MLSSCHQLVFQRSGDKFGEERRERWCGCPRNGWIGGTPLDGRDILAGGQSPAGNQQPKSGGNCEPVSITRLVQLCTDTHLLCESAQATKHSQRR